MLYRIKRTLKALARTIKRAFTSLGTKIKRAFRTVSRFFSRLRYRHKTLFIAMIAAAVFLVLGAGMTGFVIRRNGASHTNESQNGTPAMTSGAGEQTKAPASVSGETTDAAEKETASPGTKAEYEEITGYYGLLLSEKDQITYQKIVQGLEEGQESIALTGADASNIENVYKAVCNDYPEFFWLTGGYSYETTTYLFGGPGSFVLKPDISYDQEKLKDLREAFSAKTEEILRSAPTDDVYEKILYIHDYIVDQTSYNYDDYINNRLSPDDESYNAYGCLVQHSAVCAGYSEAFQWLMKASGIPCICVSGKSLKNGENHAWNCVMIDDAYYYIDVTWDDPVHTDGGPETIEHDYFCITTAELLETHIIEPGQNEPMCVDNKYDYYVHNGRWFDHYDREELLQVIRNDIGSGKNISEFKFSSKEDAVQAYNELMEDNRLYEISSANRLVFRKSGNERIFSVEFVREQ